MSNLRITGLATGLDVDNMVKQLMKTEKLKVEKVVQDRQILSWKQDLYREVISDLKKLKDSYLEIVNKDKCLLLNSNLTPYNANISDNSPVKINVSQNSILGQYEVKIDSMAKPARLESSNIGFNVNDNITGTGSININYTVNGSNSVINIDYDSSKKYKDIINEINIKSNGQLKAYYSEIANKIIIETAKTGSDVTLEISGGDVLGIADTISPQNGKDAKLYIKIPGSNDYSEVIKKSNSFSIDGMNITINYESSEITKFSITSNPKQTVEKIKQFISDYNEFIDKLNAKIVEKRNYSFKPLTEEQKSQMKDDEIKKWEEKAKQGLLNGDPVLRDLADNLRRAFFEPVSGVNITLRDIGLSTGNYTQNGKIIIDEEKLQKALESRPQEVLDLFNKTSNISYNPNLSYKSRNERNKEIGIFQRIKDIIDDNIRLTRNSSGKKGALIEIAGIKGDLTEYNSYLSKQISQKDTIINNLNKKLIDKENKYYLDFSKLEKAMQKYNDQSAWLSSQLGAMFK